MRWSWAAGAVVAGGLLLGGAYWAFSAGGKAPASGASCPPGASSPRRGPVDPSVGLSSHLFWDGAATQRDEMARMAAGGVGWTREDFNWAAIEPSPGRFLWAKPDCLMAAAAAAGLQVLPILDYATPWDTADTSKARHTDYPPRDLAAYAGFARAVVARYGPGGSYWAGRPGDPLTVVEIWNEPNAWWSWRPEPNPAGYAAMVRSVATAVRAVQPGMQILACGDLNQYRQDGTSRPWMAALLDADPALGSVVDGWSVHPYPARRSAGPDHHSARPSDDFGRVTTIHDLTVARSAARPIWITEIGWTTARDTPDGVSEATQATFVRRALERGLDEWGGFVQRVFIYSWDRSSDQSGDAEGNFGLRRHDNTTKPAWSALSGYARNHPAGPPAP